MSAHFSADWLSLREPFDHAARVAAWPALRWPARPATAAPLQVIDLACGTGANLRFLAPRLGGRQHWLLLDHDPALLEAVSDQLRPWADQHAVQLRRDGDVLHMRGDGFEAEVHRQCCDLSHGLPTEVAPGTLVTASALLDLVSAAWLAPLVAQAARAQAVALFALSVDGRVAWSPPDPLDALVLQQFTEHQQRDKGFGPALGAAATDCAAGLFARAGYDVRRAASDWLIEDEAMACAMRDGLAQAAAEMAADTTAFRSWRRPLPSARLIMGHEDLLALPGPGPRAGRSPSGAR